MFVGVLVGLLLLMRSGMALVCSGLLSIRCVSSRIASFIKFHGSKFWFMKFASVSVSYSVEDLDMSGFNYVFYIRSSGPCQLVCVFTYA